MERIGLTKGEVMELRKVAMQLSLEFNRGTPQYMGTLIADAEKIYLWIKGGTENVGDTQGREKGH